MARESKKTTNRWARLSIGYHRDQKIINVGPIGEVAFLRLLILAREMVETVEIDGAVPYMLAKRELGDIVDVYRELNKDTNFDDLINLLVKNKLVEISEDKEFIIVLGYDNWQTTKTEISELRRENRERVAAYRARNKDNNTDSGGEEEMGVYDNNVEAFEDLREGGSIKKGSRKVGKHGLNPAQVDDAETIINHMVETRKRILGGNFKVTATWWSDVKKLLNGSADSEGLTVGQACDLIDFALSHKFWHAHCQTPGGLAKHAGKLYSSDEYVTWSKRNNKPKENRPRDTLIGDSGPAQFRGNLAADKQVDWSKVSEEL